MFFIDVGVDALASSAIAWGTWISSSAMLVFVCCLFLGKMKLLRIKRESVVLYNLDI